MLLGVLDRVLGHCQLSAPTGIKIGPGEPAQILHRDDSIYPLPEPHGEVVLNTMWAFDDFTDGERCDEVRPRESPMGARAAARRRRPGRADRDAGRAAWRSTPAASGTAAGRTGPTRPRLGVILEYVSAWLRPQENHVIGVAPEVVATLPAALQELLGYNIYPPFMGYVDGRHPRRFLPGEPAVPG